MKQIHGIRLVDRTGEEILPDFEEDLPYIASIVDMRRYFCAETPWHWHGAAELVYVYRGGIEYQTPGRSHRIRAGSGGFVNCNVLHASRMLTEDTVLFIHLFDPNMLSGAERVIKGYVAPLIQARGIEMLTFEPQEDGLLLKNLEASFHLEEAAFGYELALQQALLGLWLEILNQAGPLSQASRGPSDEKVKDMMAYIGAHYSENITVDTLARAAHVSRRVCFRLFQDNLHMPPVKYIRSVRLKKAEQMLRFSKESITQIGYACGLGSSSYFGKLFHEQYGCSPGAYRQKWHDRDIN